MKKILLFFLIPLLLLAAGCASLPLIGGTVQGTGDVTLVDPARGTFVILTDDGKRYYPVNLPDAFKENRLRVKFSGKRRGNTGTPRSLGTPIELTSIEQTVRITR